MKNGIEEIIKKDSMANSIQARYKREYLGAPRDEFEKNMKFFKELLKSTIEPGKTIKDIMELSAIFINRSLGLKEVSMVLKNPNDGRFRYVVNIGFTRDVTDNLKKVEYTYDELLSISRNRGRMISEFTEFYLAEEQPAEERAYFNLPSRLGKKRPSNEDSVEGDYFGAYIYGPRKEWRGYIEYAGTNDGKIPQIKTIKTIELIALIITAVIACKNF